MSEDHTLTDSAPEPTATQPSRAVAMAVFALLLVTAATVATSGLSFWRKAQSFQPSGVELEARADSLVITGASLGSGLEVGDVVLLVNGERPLTTSEFESELKRRDPSEVAVVRDGQLETVPHHLPPLQIDLTYIVLALIGTAYLLIGLYTLMRQRDRSVLLFHLWCIASAVLYFVTPVPPFDATDKFLFGLDLAARLLLPPLTLHFFLIFPRPSERTWINRFLPLLYAPSAALLATNLHTMFVAPATSTAAQIAQRIRIGDQVELFLIALFGLAAAGAVAMHIARAKSWEQGRQILWIAIGIAGGYFPFLLFYVVPRAAGLNVPQWLSLLAALPLALVPLTFAYSILRYRLWDITVIVRDVATYTLTILLGILGFSMLSLVIDRGVPENEALARNILNIGAAVLIGGLMVPTKGGIGATLHRLQYRHTLARRRSLARLGDELLEERDLDRLASALVREVEECLDLEACNLFVIESDRLVPLQEEPVDLGLEVAMLGDDIWEESGVEFPRIVLADTAGLPFAELVRHGYHYAFPLKMRNRRLGMLLVGHRAGDVPLSSDDKVLIRQLLNQASLAIENAQLLEQMQRQLAEVIELKQFNEEIIESSPSGIAVLDREGRVVTANLAFAALAGMERSAVRRRRLSELLPLRLVPADDGGLSHARYVDPQGRERFLQVNSADFLGGSSEGHRVVVVDDVTERLAMERELQEKDRLAALGSLAAGVAHEVNTPLTGISSYAQMLLQDTPADDPRHLLLSKMERQTFRAARIVNSLLDFARNGQRDSLPMAVGPVLRESVELLSDSIERKSTQVHWKGEVDRSTVASADETELGQVFTNLVVNALDAMPEGGNLTLDVEQRNASTVAISIQDDGPGIPEELHDKVFEPFFSTKKTTGGTGLGLSISREIVRRHHGELSLQSAPGGGCRFTVELPLFRRDRPIVERPETAQEEPS